MKGKGEQSTTLEIGQAGGEITRIISVNMYLSKTLSAMDALMRAIVFMLMQVSPCVFSPS